MSALAERGRTRARALLARGGDRLADVATRPQGEWLVLRALPSVLARRFDPASAGDLDAEFELHVRGGRSARFAVRIADRRCTVRPGAARDPGATVELSADDAIRLVSGAVGWPELLAGHRLALGGDAFLALRFPPLFALPAGPLGQTSGVEVAGRGRP